MKTKETVEERGQFVSISVDEALHRINSTLEVVKIHVWHLKQIYKKKAPQLSDDVMKHLVGVDAKIDEIARFVVEIEKRIPKP